MTHDHLTPGARSAGAEDDGSAAFIALRPRLLGIAYRLLGSMWDAEDVVADAMVRWLRTDRSEVREPAAFLTTVVSRLALDQLRSARAVRETYAGPWLPEPVIADDTLDPLDSLVKRDTLSLATLRLMEQLTPPERAVFVLREAFDVPYSQIAEILDVSEANARQLLHRAQTRLGERHRRTEADESRHAELLERLLWAADEGKLAELEEMLAADVVSYNDGGGRARAALVPVVGRTKIMAFLGGLRRRFGPTSSVRMLEVNGQPAAQFSLGGQDALVQLEVRDGKIVSIFTVLNPDKLSYLYRQTGGPPVAEGG
ncbi:MAG TPA: RNA polymerase sigma factor SigJ [Solirubrobacteraceae bacterium]